ncbi:hypothetical protein B566_EDAN013159 [Ephemera danica]|nr:hypothetical protein B566_EDAN013159 [Ephemera danica]
MDQFLPSLQSSPIICCLLMSPDLAVGGNITLNLLVAGLVRYSDLRPTPFTQDFMITAQEDKWKIVSDCFRLQEDLSK